MRASELIRKLQAEVERSGDLEVNVEVNGVWNGRQTPVRVSKVMDVPRDVIMVTVSNT